MRALRRLVQVIATAALGAAATGAQAVLNCGPVSAEDLLGAAPPGGTDGFVLTEKLCGTSLVRVPSSPAVAAEPEPQAQVRPQSTAQPEVVLQASAPVMTMALPHAPAWRPASRDAAGQARIRALAPLVAEVAQRHDIDPLLLHALAHVESRHQAQAVSPAGARGLMQVMPATARSVGLAEADRALLSPQANLEASARYLKQLQARFGNDLRLVLAAYNAGEGAVERHGRRVPPFAETQAYVRDVLAVYAELRRRFAGGAA